MNFEFDRDQTIEVVRTSRIKTASIKIIDGSIKLAIPAKLSDTEIKQLIKKRSFWIKQKIKQQASIIPYRPKEYVSGEGFPYLGRNYRLKLLHQEGTGVKLRDGYLECSISKKADSKKIKEILVSWYKEHALERLIEKAKKHAVGGERLNSFEAQFPSKTQKSDTASANPPQELLNSLLSHYQNRQFNDAEKLSVEITHDFPKHQFAWKVLGAVLGATGRKSEAVDANQTAVILSPQDAEAHSNLGIALQKLGRLDEAEASYNQAIELKPNFAEAHYNWGITLQELGRLDEAEASYNQAIELKPDFAEAHSNLGNALKELGRFDEALTSFNQAIALKPNFAEALVNLGIAIKNVRFNSSNPKLYPPLTELLTAENLMRPRTVAKSILSLLKQDTQINDLLLKKILL